MDDLVAATMPQRVRVLFNVGDTVLVNELSPSTQFQVTSSSFDARSSSTTYRLKPKSGTKKIVIIVGEDNIALASDGSPLNPGGDEASLRLQESRDSRGLGQMINVKDAERGDTIETTLDGRVGFTRVLNICNQPGLGPYFEYVNADGNKRFCFNQRVRLLAKSTSATRSSCTSFEQPPPVYRGKHPRYDELRFEMLGLLHGGYSSGKLSEPLTRKLQALGISRESSRNPRKPRGAVALNPKFENAEQDLPASIPEELDRSNKIDVGDLVKVTIKSRRPQIGWVARKVLLSRPTPNPANPLGQGPRGPDFKIVGGTIGTVQNLTEDRVKLIRKGTPWEKNNMLKNFPPCESEDFDIEAFEAQVAATDDKEAANEQAYRRKKEAMSRNDEIEYDTPLEELETDTEQDEAQIQRSRGTSLDEPRSVIESETTETALGGFHLGD